MDCSDNSFVVILPTYDMAEEILQKYPGAILMTGATVPRLLKKTVKAIKADKSEAGSKKKPRAKKEKKPEKDSEDDD
uniref:Uncharacterized protein n=1 Tax=viral metagenome TaxID=1070528 RepID=A0A6C0J822_9ZZZZ